MGLIRVLIADDHSIVREGIRHVLATEADFAVVGEARSGVEAVALADSLQPDVVVMDISMPELSGLEATAQIRERHPDVRVLMLSIHDHEEYVLRSIRAGAQAYLRKDASPKELRHAIRALRDGTSVFSTSVAKKLSSALRNEQREQTRRARLDALTAREREVLIEIARGGTNKDIARHFGISVRTVESHREALMRKLELQGAASLTRFALEAGLLRSSTDP